MPLGSRENPCKNQFDLDEKMTISYIFSKKSHKTLAKCKEIMYNIVVCEINI